MICYVGRKKIFVLLAYIRWVCEYPTHLVDEQEVQLMIASVETYDDCVIYDLHAGKRVYTSPALACVCLMENGDMVDVFGKSGADTWYAKGHAKVHLILLHGSGI